MPNGYLSPDRLEAIRERATREGNADALALLAHADNRQEVNARAARLLNVTHAESEKTAEDFRRCWAALTSLRAQLRRLAEVKPLDPKIAEKIDRLAFASVAELIDSDPDRRLRSESDPGGRLQGEKRP